jgi:hypothetical protein
VTVEHCLVTTWLIKQNGNKLLEVVTLVGFTSTTSKHHSKTILNFTDQQNNATPETPDNSATGQTVTFSDKEKQIILLHYMDGTNFDANLTK